MKASLTAMYNEETVSRETLSIGHGPIVIEPGKRFQTMLNESQRADRGETSSLSWILLNVS